MDREIICIRFPHGECTWTFHRYSYFCAKKLNVDVGDFVIVNANEEEKCVVVVATADNYLNIEHDKHPTISEIDRAEKEIMRMASKREIRKLKRKYKFKTT